MKFEFADMAFQGHNRMIQRILFQYFKIQFLIIASPMQSPFIYLHNKKLTIPQDSDRYQRTNKTLYRKEAFKFAYMILLCKLYDMSNLPMLRSHKVYIYTFVVMSLSSISYYLSSQPLTEFLFEMDKKYKSSYQKQIKNKNFQGIV